MYHLRNMNSCAICGRATPEDNKYNFFEFWKYRHSSDRCPVCGEYWHNAIMAVFNALDSDNRQKLVDGYIIGRLEADGGENCPAMDNFTYDSHINGIAQLRLFVAVCWHYMAVYGIYAIEITDYQAVGNLLALAMDYGKEIDCGLPACQVELINNCASVFSDTHIRLFVENGKLLAE